MIWTLQFSVSAWNDGNEIVDWTVDQFGAAQITAYGVSVDGIDQFLRDALDPPRQVPAAEE